MDLTLHSSVEGYFKELLDEAIHERNLKVSPTTEYYLVGLLGELTKSSWSDDALALKLAGASDPAERVGALKEVGDTSLVLSGLFSSSLQRSVVQVDYYIGLGGAAYKELSTRLRASSVSEVYRELAAKFPKFVDVLASVRQQFLIGENDAVSLYENWKTKKLDWVEKRLEDLGMLVGGDKGTLQ